MPTLETLLAGLLATLFGLGVASGVLLAFVRRRRAATTRRLAEVMEQDVLAASDEEPPPGQTPVLSRTRLVVEAARRRPATMRMVFSAIAIASAITGLATGATLLFVVAALAITGFVWLGERARYHARIERQMPVALGLLIAGLRAGYSVPQAISLAARETPEPTSGELRRVVQEFALGVDLPAALLHLAQRTQSSDYELVSIIVGVQRQVGGNLAEILDAVADTLRARGQLRQQVSALTAQQRLSSTILTLLPVGILLLLLAINRPFVEPLFTTGLGRVLLTIAAVLVGAGWVTMRSLGRVEV